MTYSLEDKRVLIVGGSSDIAAALATDLLQEGARVTLAGRDIEKTAVAAKAIGDAVRPIALDLSDEESIQQPRIRSGPPAGSTIVSAAARALLTNPFITGETLHVDGGARWA